MPRTLLLVACLLLFAGLGSRDLWSSHEARAAMNARSVLTLGDALPRLEDGSPDLQKPPGFYWLVALVGYLRGDIDALAVRLPSTLAAIALIALVVGVLWRGYNRPRAAVFAGLVLACSAHFPWLARVGRIDMALALTTAVAVLSLVALTVAEGRRWWALLVAAYAASAAGVLLKGPIGLVLPGAVVCGVLLSRGEWPAFWEFRSWITLLRRLGVVPGFLFFLGICLPVYLWVEHASDGRFFREFLWYHNVQRAVGGSRLREHSVAEYIAYLPMTLLPWSPLLLSAFVPRLYRFDAAAKLGLAWLVAGVVLLSLAKFKRADYLAPVYPGAAIFLGCVLDRLSRLRFGRYVRVGVVTAGALALIAWGVKLHHSQTAESAERDVRPLAALFREHVPAPIEAVFFRAEAHALAFHVGRPMAHVIQWHDLHARLRGGLRTMVVARKELPEAIFSTRGYTFTELAERDGWVLVRVEPNTARQDATPDARTHQPAADRTGAAVAGVARR